MLKNKSILITGGTGSFGRAFIRYLLKKNYFKKIIIFSRDELKQFEMKNDDLFKKHHKRIRFFVGDIRDKDRLMNAFNEVDYVIHAAALKQVDTAEYNPFEFVKTNIQGTENVIQAAAANSVKKLIALSTDKAVSPINLYGATKLCADKLIIAANNIFGNKNTSFSLVRYGNVMGSRGSIVPLFKKQLKEKKSFLITDPSMTRFNLTLNDCVETVMWALKKSIGGEIIIRKSPSYKLIDVAKAISNKNKINVIGIRAGEKKHEELIPDTGNCFIYESGDYYILIDKVLKENISKIKKNYKFKKEIKSFSYNSKNNKKFLNQIDLRKLINNS
jgi:UDP-N-acetylglucosamine 4,6-dehydratase/5-epimerase